MDGELVDRQLACVALTLVVGHCLVVGAAADECLVEGFHASLGAAERVGDALRGEGALVQPASPISAQAAPNGLRLRQGRLVGGRVGLD